MDKAKLVYLLSLGCAKNLVDSELLSGLLKRGGYTICDEAAAADIIIVNSCGFIEAAKAESIEYILELAAARKEGALLAVAGCMAGAYGAELTAALPEIDLLITIADYPRINELLAAKSGETAAALDAPANLFLWRELSTTPGTAYLRIADGCDNHCSYCLIPTLRGAYVSRTIEDICAEAEQLRRRGVRELVLIAQDSTRWGLDLYGERRLPELLERLAQIDFAMIRLLYLYPSDIDERLLKVMAAQANICHYLDMPIQHGDDGVLAAMNRRDSAALIEAKVALIRDYLPDVMLRTTVMVGFPGEDERAFRRLLELLRRCRFDWVGAFPYYAEDGTPAALLPAQVEAELKQQRLDAVLAYSETITRERLLSMVGMELAVVVEGEAGPPYQDGWQRARSQYQAPEVDGAIYVRAALRPGQLAKVRITAIDDYDMIGELV
ncbi:MAG: 30S ribosomal protein S12 methylthiotransferase RimO [Bacillota bacterium]|nr:30S ribosomal protein S12 methylthiotransferase RimO [Bacillota bacterium]